MHCKRGDNSCSEVYDVTNLMIKFFQEVLKFMHMYKNYIVHDVQYYYIQFFCCLQCLQLLIHVQCRLLLLATCSNIHKFTHCCFLSCRSEGVFSSFYSYFSSEPATNKGPTPEEQEASKQAQSCIRDCHLEQLILDSKFLREDSLQELIKVRQVLT